jgi:hypothetical protein
MLPFKLRLSTLVKLGVALILAAFVVPMVADLTLPRRCATTETLVCDQCGIRLWISKDSPVGVDPLVPEHRELVETGLSKWFAVHFDQKCAHSWRHNHSTSDTYLTLAGWRLWSICGGAGSTVTPSLVGLNDDDRLELERMYSEDPSKCREFIHEQLRSR